MPEHAIPPQPVLDDLIAGELLPEVTLWFAAENVACPVWIRGCLRSALRESADAYERARHLDLHHGWPVDKALVLILIKAEAVEAKLRQGAKELESGASSNVVSLFGPNVLALRPGH